MNAPSGDAAPAADGLTRRFGERIAVDQVSFTVRRGEVFGFLGPNSAGKSTTVRMLTGFLAPTAGRAFVAEFDVSERPAAARRRIGEGRPAGLTQKVGLAGSHNSSGQRVDQGLPCPDSSVSE